MDAAEESTINWKRIAAVGALVFVAAISGYEVKANAQRDPNFPPPCTAVIPAEWGKYRGNVAGSGLIFEDKNGTLRIVPQLPCPVDGTPDGVPRVLAEIRRR